jgi:uncharacterized repeat protein (TIGR01451 family)
MPLEANDTSAIGNHGYWMSLRANATGRNMRLQHKNLWILASFALALILLLLVAGASTQRTSASTPEGTREHGPLEPALLRALAEAQEGESVRVIVYMHDQADLDGVVHGASSATEARTRIVSTLQAAAAQSQAALLPYLDKAQRDGTVEQYTQFWIVNGIAVQAQPSVIRDLAARPEVSMIQLDHYRQYITGDVPAPVPENPQDAMNSPQSVEWGIAQIRADEVWASLHISGTGVVVAGMDSGVDWLHPALQTNYRGYNPHGPNNHTYSWFDATNPSTVYPIDDRGHGTHTMGTIAGQGGIGVAPGARWIAVKVLDSDGFGLDSWIHAGFQWLLAPGGNPNLAPDIVNCSWGSANGGNVEFQSDLHALRAAGILAVFSSGNNGPGERTVASPASLPGAFSVGATDEYDQVTVFSSRGPSPWGETRPHVTAPGVHIRSSMPGGTFGEAKGTSMAAPHVSGVAALLHSISPTLSITQTTYIITSTAVPLGSPIPNNDTGWGRVDAFAAVASLAHPGFITGTVTQTGSGTPISGAAVSATPHVGGGGGIATTDSDGRYSLALVPSTYDLTVSAFGYVPATTLGVTVLTDTTSVVDVALTPLPAGSLRGRITDANTEQPITATVDVPGTPREATTAVYSFTLPEGTYTVRARNTGYRVVTASVIITAGQVTTADLALPPAPSILLVDSGRWYHESQIAYFRQALDDAAYTYDEWAIRFVPDEVPTADDLLPYDIVVWSAPEDAPGYIGAQDAITGYLSAGGRLFLTGQDVGFLDGSGLFYYWPYYQQYLKAQFDKDHSGIWTLKGTPGDLFAGLTITITGPGGADNQGYPDTVAVLDPDAAAPVFAYQGGGYGGVRASTCLDYRTLYLSFGFEAINDRTARREVMSRALDWLAADQPTAGLEVLPSAQTRIGPPGATVTYTLRVRHVGQAGGMDTVTVTLDSATWTSELALSSLTLAPCTSATLAVSVTIPAAAAWDAQDVMTVSARSTLSPTLSSTSVITTKAPAPVLLVDDDIFYEQLDKYEATLDSLGTPYDVWQTCPAIGGCVEQTPPPETLSWYPVVVWWTGYDWYYPVRPSQREALATYLNGGGRLFLSSQDYLYYHHDEAFARDTLGVLDHTEDTQPSQAHGVPEDPIGSWLGPWTLNYPFENVSDAVVPMPDTAVPFRDEQQRGIAVARRDGKHATVFCAFPFEALPEEARPEAMQQTIGYLSWLGSSTFSADRASVAAGSVVTYTAVLHNDGLSPITASLTNTLPISLTLVPGSVTGPASYDTSTRVISWTGSLAVGGNVTITYRATVTTGLSALTSISNGAALGIQDQFIQFDRIAVIKIDAPDLSPSILRCDPPAPQPGAVVTCTLTIANRGLGNASTVVGTNVLPSAATLITPSVTLDGGGTVETLTDTLRWTGALTASAQVTITYQLALPANPIHPPLYTVAFLEDGLGGAWERPAWIVVEPERFYFPLLGNNVP